MTTTTADLTTGMTTRLKTQWDTGRAQLASVPATLRARWTAAGERFLRMLNLPTKSDLAALTARLDEIEARLAKKAPVVAEKRSRKPKKA